MHEVEVTPDRLVGELMSALEARGVKIAHEASREDILRIAIAVIKGEDPVEALTPVAVVQSSPRWPHDLQDGEEKELITNSLRQHHGNAKMAMITLQKELIAPWIKRGFSVEHTTAKLGERYPNIF